MSFKKVEEKIKRINVWQTLRFLKVDDEREDENFLKAGKEKDISV